MLDDSDELWLIITASLPSKFYESQFIYSLEQDRFILHNVNSVMKVSNGSQVTIYNHGLDVQ